MSPLQRGVETWLGLLILGIVLGSWLRLPSWLINSFGFLFSATLVILAGDFIYGSFLGRIAWLRGVHFAESSVHARVPCRLRWFGANWSIGARRYRVKKPRRGAARALFRQRGSELLTLSVIPLALGAAICGLYVENKWTSIALVIGAPALGLGAMERLLTLSQRLGRERRQ